MNSNIVQAYYDGKPEGSSNGFIPQCQKLVKELGAKGLSVFNDQNKDNRDLVISIALKTFGLVCLIPAVIEFVPSIIAGSTLGVIGSIALGIIGYDSAIIGKNIGDTSLWSKISEVFQSFTGITPIILSKEELELTIAKRNLSRADQAGIKIFHRVNGYLQGTIIAKPIAEFTHFTLLRIDGYRSLA